MQQVDGGRLEGANTMYEHILVATGGSPWSDAAVAYAIAITVRTGGTLHILTVLTNPAVYATPDVMGGSEVVAEIMERDGHELLARAADHSVSSGYGRTAGAYLVCET